MDKRFHEVKALSKEEIDTLASLYKKANEVNNDDAWQDINLYFEELGNKYHFNPKYYYISTDGEIIKTKICYRCNGVANSTRGIKYDRLKDGLGWQNRPICWSCYMKKYPYKAKKELMRTK